MAHVIKKGDMIPTPTTNRNPKKYSSDGRKRPHVIGNYLNGYQRSDKAFVLKSPYVNTRQNPIGHFTDK